MNLSEFKPTPFDQSPAGFFDSDGPRRNWLVAPVSRTRDSDALAESNFAAALDMLGGESDTVEIHRFGHWGPGWFELILCAPCHESTLYDMQEALENYPVLNDEDFSNREFEAYLEDWDNWAASDFASAIAKEFNLSDPAADILSDVDRDTLREFFQECNPCGDWYDSEGANVRRSVKGCTREGLAAFLWTNRRTV